MARRARRRGNGTLGGLCLFSSWEASQRPIRPWWHRHRWQRDRLDRHNGRHNQFGSVGETEMRRPAMNRHLSIIAGLGMCFASADIMHCHCGAALAHQHRRYPPRCGDSTMWSASTHRLFRTQLGGRERRDRHSEGPRPTGLCAQIRMKRLVMTRHLAFVATAGVCLAWSSIFDAQVFGTRVEAIRCASYRRKCHGEQRIGGLRTTPEVLDARQEQDCDARRTR